MRRRRSGASAQRPRSLRRAATWARERTHPHRRVDEVPPSARPGDQGAIGNRLRELFERGCSDRIPTCPPGLCTDELRVGPSVEAEQDDRSPVHHEKCLPRRRACGLRMKKLDPRNRQAWRRSGDCARAAAEYRNKHECPEPPHGVAGVKAAPSAKGLPAPNREPPHTINACPVHAAAGFRRPCSGACGKGDHAFVCGS